MICNDCKYAIWDYEEYYGNVRRAFIDGCRKGLDDPDADEYEEDCEGYEEYEPCN